jgi:2-polyprenyl-3-methyl-5-hydroxy-6-metoxy-1,4-benzoquinol methylase
MNRTVAVVLPTHGGGTGVPAVVRDLAIAAFALAARGDRLSVLVLDPPGSTVGDASVKSAADHGLELALCPAPAEVGEAYLAGFAEVVARGDADLVVTLDASGRHDPVQIPRLVEQLDDVGADVVVGSRWARGSGTPGLGFGRWLRGRSASLAFRTITGTHAVLDATTTFRVARTEVIRDFLATGPVHDGPFTVYTMQTSFTALCVARGYRVVEGPIIYRFAAGREARLTTADVTAFARQLVRLRGQTRELRQHRAESGRRSFRTEQFGAAEDLERLGTARHFFEWVLDEFEPYLRGSVLEVGAGLGTITRLLADRYPELRLVALEPAGNVFGELSSFAALSPRVTACQTTLADYRPDADRLFDAVVYLNVLEHIEDDAAELRLASAVLRPGGAVLVFGPAMEALYSELDHRAGHYRRYDVDGLRTLLEDAGLQPVYARYFDVLGVLPYLVVYRLLRRDAISGGSMWGYDRVLVPLSRLVQKVVPTPPLGKNVIAVAVKR